MKRMEWGGMVSICWLRGYQRRASQDGVKEEERGREKKSEEYVIYAIIVAGSGLRSDPDAWELCRGSCGRTLPCMLVQ